jgi:small subunit ribosomal protein S15
MFNKKAVINKFATGEADTGSSNVQIAIFTKRIEYLTEHCKSHKKDHATRKSLIGLVNKRRSLLSYVKKKSDDKYQEIIKKLNLRK